MLSALPAAGRDAQLVGRAVLPDVPGMSGLSGIEVSGDGNSFVAIGDRGWFVTGRIERDDGAPVSVVPDLPEIVMHDMHGFPVRSHERDSEGLAIGPDGRLFVSFEIYHRVRSWRDRRGPATWMPDLPDVPHLRPNAGIEALAIGPDGALYAVPEALVDAGRIPVYRYILPPPLTDAAGNPVDRYVYRRWERAFSLPARGLFRPVGADFGPDGRLYLLERAFLGPLGYRSRVRRFALGPDGPGEETEILSTRAGTHGNLEGIAVWRDAGGGLRLTMIDDDNGGAFRRGEIVEYRIVGGGGGG